MEASQWLKFVQYWLLPAICVVCSKAGAGFADLCSVCHDSLARIDRPCRSCALPLPAGDHGSEICGRCLGRRQRMTRTVAALAYKAPVSSLIAGFKYHGALQHGRVLADLLAVSVQAAYRDMALPQLLVPVPLHPSRLRERGFNQALMLAQQLGAALQIPVAATALTRTRETRSQQGLSAKERKRNLRGAFTLHADLSAYDSVALIDDVVTTMSTMHELARVLRGAHPAIELHVWCLARA